MIFPVITPILVAGYAALGAASAFGGWLFNRLIHFRKHATALDAQVTELEKS